MGNAPSSSSQANRPSSRVSLPPPPAPYPYPPPSVYTTGQQIPYYQPGYNGQYPPQQPAQGGFHQAGQAYHPPAYIPSPQQLVAGRTQEYQRTATIRNQVNLKKPSLKLVPAGQDKYIIAFTFDASAPCRVMTFINAREDLKRGCKMMVPGNIAAPVNYEKGLDQKFPPASESTPAATGHCIDVSQHQLKELMAVPTGPGEAVPVVVRLEAVTDEGRAEGRTMEGLEPGCELPSWVQSQTTYARVVKEEDGTLGLRVLKQKIWVKGESYELQEIYGMEQNRGVAMGTPTGPVSAPAQTADGFEDVEGNECVICMSAPRDTAALPCRHMCMCHGCASALKTQTNKCPICRNEIESLLHIKINKLNGECEANKQPPISTS